MSWWCSADATGGTPGAAVPQAALDAIVSAAAIEASVAVRIPEGEPTIAPDPVDVTSARVRVPCARVLIARRGVRSREEALFSIRTSIFLATEALRSTKEPLFSAPDPVALDERKPLLDTRAAALDERAPLLDTRAAALDERAPLLDIRAALLAAPTAALDGRSEPRALAAAPLDGKSAAPCVRCYVRPMKVAIVGAGVMGCAAALELAQRGVDVVLLERAVPGAEASSAAAGILGAQAELHGDEDDAPLFVRARAAWAGWAQSLRDASGIDVGYRLSGVLRVAHTEEDAAALGREVAMNTRLGLRASLLDGAEARRVEPELAPDVRAAAHFPDDAQVDPGALLRALMALLARDPHVAVRAGTTVQRLLVEGDRCTGVRLDEGELRADATVLAAGSWSSLVPGVPADVPVVRPVRGQIVLLDERPPRARSIVFGAGTYVVPRGDGRVVCGSTTEHVGFRKEVTAAGVHAILGGALACVPSLGTAQLAGAWSNFRPHVEGRRGLVGASTLPGLFLATGHYRNGILLSKITADAVANAVTRR
jgi:glycine oxidase